MKQSLIRWGAVFLLVAAMVGCGGSGGGSDPSTASPAVLEAIAKASALAVNDTAANPTAAFVVVQNAGIPAVSIKSLPVVNFTVFSDSNIKTGLTTANARFAIAKLVPGSNGNPDQWVSYITRQVSGKAGFGPNASPVLASAPQAATDMAAATQLVYNPAGYYTYTFSTDIKSVAGIAYDPALTHRVAIQLSYKNVAGEEVLVNPYFDFTVVDGKSVMVTDPAKTRKMTDVASCNGCHEKLALHGGGRVDTQYCVMCHNTATVDPESGNNLDLATMTHKIHAGKLLNKQLAAGGEDYAIWGYGNAKHDYAEVGFPQDLRNCAVCHSSANPNTPQGDNWKTRVSKEACLTCHANKAGSPWDISHTAIAVSVLKSATAKAIDMGNQFCSGCHLGDVTISPERVHWNQNEENAAKYKMNIESAVFNDTTDKKARTVTVTYFLSNPVNGSAWDLKSDATKFGSLRFILAYQNMTSQVNNGQPGPITEFSAYNNGGNSASAYANAGVNLGGNRFKIDIKVLDDSTIAMASGTARVVSYGQIKENKLNVKTRHEITPTVVANVVVQHSYKDVLLSGNAMNPRRVIVSNEKCNVCHGALGTTSGSNTADNAFHSGARNTVEACVVCHDANRASSTIMTNGLALNESYQFKRMIHGIHGNSRRSYPFTIGNTVVGVFNKDGSSATGGAALSAQLKSDGTPAVENYAAEVAWPGVGINCNACHVNNSYKQDLGPLGATVSPRVTGADPLTYKVISPMAASCTSCHDSGKTMGHVTTFSDPPAAFGDRTQAQIIGLPKEGCYDCHASGKFKGVDIVHGQN
ncbi:MAG: OmcA/MtrC family decaheme c-type cytochrome [Rhodoferax sp.]|nr:OmcA/MtrC family decaheme c-type cytochrome [Rhodoferax sp.]